MYLLDTNTVIYFFKGVGRVSERLLETTPTAVAIYVSLREASASAEIRARLEQLGQPIGPLDNLLAGTAVAHGATFVTRNVNEFSRVDGLRVENWY